MMGYGGCTVLVAVAVTVAVTVAVEPAAVTVTETVVGSQTHAPLLAGTCGLGPAPGRDRLTVCWLVMALVKVVVESCAGTFWMAVGAVAERLLKDTSQSVLLQTRKGERCTFKK